MSPPASSTRALNAILPHVEASPYEAHQKARTFASRYVKSGQYDVAIEVLFESAKALMKVGEKGKGSGTDLAGFLIDVYEAKDEGVNEESRGRLTQLIALAGSEGNWRKTIIDKSIAWSAKYGEYPAGDPALHHYVGELLYKDGLYNIAESHLLASPTRDSARLLAIVYASWASSTSSYGAFALRGTLPHLLNGNILAARAFIFTYVSLVPGVSKDTLPIDATTNFIPTPDPILDFSQLAVATCQRAQGASNKVMRESWVRLCGTYQTQGSAEGNLLRDPNVRNVLNELATLYFAIPAPKGQGANPMAEMMAGLFGGGAPGGASQAKRVLVPPTKLIGGADGLD